MAMSSNSLPVPEALPGGLEARAPVGFRTQPHNIDAEQALLGAILVNNEAYHRVADFLRPEHFYEPVHGRIFEAITRLIESARVADHVTLKVAFDEDEALRELDGAQYLARLARAAETILNAAGLWPPAARPGAAPRPDPRRRGDGQQGLRSGRCSRVGASRSRWPSSSCSCWPRRARSRAASAGCPAC